MLLLTWVRFEHSVSEFSHRSNLLSTHKLAQRLDDLVLLGNGQFRV